MLLYDIIYDYLITYIMPIDMVAETKTLSLLLTYLCIASLVYLIVKIFGFFSRGY